jgi:NIMA (never in mitosis gene a)-related kinase 1/4/5
MDKLTTREKNALNEVRMLASLEHPNIIGYNESFIDSGKYLCIVLDFAQEGDLYQKIVSHKKLNKTFTEEQVWRYFIGCVRAMGLLHSM